MIAIPNMDKPNCQKCIEDCLNIPLDCYPDEYGENRKGEKIVCQLIEIVTCGECKWWNRDYKTESNGLCERNICGFTEPTDFCSYGERRSDGNGIMDNSNM